mmetsp:Transcript_108577/g.188562  ORF Transcript_108577/g.188562 Transcript_108577/m.188562 type:complete len:157 (+) Transcript_108577:141-611(+)
MLQLALASTALACMASGGEAVLAGSTHSRQSKAVQPDHLYRKLERFGDHQSLTGAEQASKATPKLQSSIQTSTARPDPAAAPRPKTPFGKGFQGWDQTELQDRYVFRRDYVKDDNPEHPFLKAEPRRLHRTPMRSVVASGFAGAGSAALLLLHGFP